jgi:hypothetical protein
MNSGVFPPYMEVAGSLSSLEIHSVSRGIPLKTMKSLDTPSSHGGGEGHSVMS